jgi:hypothetical protein
MVGRTEGRDRVLQNRPINTTYFSMTTSASKDGKSDIIYSLALSLKMLSIYLSVIPQEDL